MGDHPTMISPWDGYCFEFTKEASEAAFKAIKQKCQPAYGSDPDLKAALMATIPAAPTTTLGQELLADEIFKKLTS